MRPVSDDPAGHTGPVRHDAAEAIVGPHGSGDHGDDHGHDDHGHVEAALGPIDIQAWGAGAIGILLGLIVAACLAIATAAPTVIAQGG